MNERTVIVTQAIREMMSDHVDSDCVYTRLSHLREDSAGHHEIEVVKMPVAYWCWQHNRPIVGYVVAFANLSLDCLVRCPGKTLRLDAPCVPRKR